MATTEHAVKRTYEDYCRAPDDKRYELLNGELMMVPAPNIKHQKILGRLHVELDRFVQQHELGEVYVAPVDVVLSDTGRRAARRAVHLPSAGRQDHRRERTGSTRPRDRNPLAVDRRPGPRGQARTVRQARGARVLDHRSGSRDRRRPSATGREARTHRPVRPGREPGNGRAPGTGA